ncbi:MAG: twin-arginine translocase subunit TatC [Microgenomates group bacterium]
MNASTKIQEDTPSFLQAHARYIPFLMEVRRRVVLVVSVFLIGSAIGFIYYEPIIKIILTIFDFKGINIVFTSPFQFINLAFNTALLLGSILVIPLLVFQILLFIRPALTRQEYKLIVSLLPLSILLFIFGMVFGITIMRYMIVLFYEKSIQLQIGNFLDVSQFLSQVLITGLLMGIGFQFPVFLTILLKIKIISYETLVKKRVFAYAISLLFAALLPPSDLISLFFLTLPLILLFELTLLLNRFILRNHV